MKRRLFWKILIAFWLTFLAITQGVWLLMEHKRGAERFVPPMIPAAAAVMEQGGIRAFEAFKADLPEEMARGLAAKPYGGVAQASEFARVVELPTGETWVVEMQPRLKRGFAFNAPPELIVLGLLGGLLFSSVLAWYLTEPIRLLRNGFDSLAHGNLQTRVQSRLGRRNDEIADLGRDFDRMAMRLEHLVAARDRLLHDVSHEIRSPLARMQLALGLLRQKPVESSVYIGRMQTEIERLDLLVDELLTLTRAEHDADAPLDDYVDLVEVVRSVIEDARFEGSSDGASIALTIDAPSDEEARPAIRGNAQLIRRALENVVRNAVRFTPENGEVNVSVGLAKDKRSYMVEVADRGSGIDDPELLSRLFEPFVRKSGSKDGHGLGLAIARRAVEAHGGRITAGNRDGGGFSVTLTLPATSGS